MSLQKRGTNSPLFDFENTFGKDCFLILKINLEKEMLFFLVLRMLLERMLFDFKNAFGEKNVEAKIIYLFLKNFFPKLYPPFNK